ncbi:hypothetical protein H2514_00285 [Lysobacter sp. CW239]|nr:MULTISPECIES: hypothetical protein [Lysobacter]QOD91170.1 hypothetical protein H2514_00285 [Lysobacter sp. CW239]
MTTRAMGPMAGIGWLTRALNLGRNNPKAIFGGVALLTLTMLVAAVAGAMLQAGIVMVLGNSISAMVAGMAVMMVVVVVLMAMLLVGFLRLIDAVESGRPARALGVFAGFGDLAASLRTIGFFVLLAIVQNLLLLGLLSVLASDVIGWYVQAMQASMAGGAPPELTSLPNGLGIASVLMLVIGLVFYGVQAVGLCQIALRGRGVFGAMADGFAGAVKNLLPLLVFVLACLVAMVVLAIAVFLLAMLIGLIGKFVGVWLAIVLAVPLYFAAMLAMYAVMFGAMYHLWRDVCDGGSRDEAVMAEALTA